MTQNLTVSEMATAFDISFYHEDEADESNAWKLKECSDCKHEDL